MKVNNKNIIINKLKNSNIPISGELLSSQLGISRTAIWKNIQKLIQEGYTIKSSHDGYILKQENDLLLPYEFEKDGNLYIYKEQTDSTMDIARDLIYKGKATTGNIIVAESQINGRGKDSNSFNSPKGGLYFTMIFFPESPLCEISLYPMAGVIAVKKSIESLLDETVSVKWPFETWMQDKKISGILHEYSVKGNKCQWLTLGIGIYIDGGIQRRILLETIKDKLFDLLKDKNNILQSYKLTTNIIDKHKTFSIEGKNINGKVIDIDQTGTILLQSEHGFSYGYIGNSSIKDKNNEY